MLGFQPEFKIAHNWDALTTMVRTVATDFVHTGKYLNHLIYESGASVVCEMPGGGWISKSGPSVDFFVMGGIPETELLDTFFKETFPTLTFTPATVCWSSNEVPMHRDSIKNEQVSFVYPLHDHPARGTVYGPDGAIFEYGTKADQPTLINIREMHHVTNITKPRIWFSIHMHEDIEKVKKVFDNLPKYQYNIE